MIDLWATIATALITLAGAWFGYWLVGKPRLIVFSPNSTVFQLEPPQEGGHQMTIRAGQLVLQNNGRKTAHNVQLIAEPGPVPWGYNMFPPIDHSIRIGSQSEWILELGFLGPGENVTIQI